MTSSHSVLADFRLRHERCRCARRRRLCGSCARNFFRRRRCRLTGGIISDCFLQFACITLLVHQLLLTHFNGGANHVNSHVRCGGQLLDGVALQVNFWELFGLEVLCIWLLLLLIGMQRNPNWDRRNSKSESNKINSLLPARSHFRLDTLDQAKFSIRTLASPKTVEFDTWVGRWKKAEDCLLESALSASKSH